MSNQDDLVLGEGIEVNSQQKIDEEQQLSDSESDQEDILDDLSSPLPDEDPRAKSIKIIKTRSYQTNVSDLAYILGQLEKFDHFEQIKNEEGYEDLLKQSLDHLHYEHIQKGKFLFHYGDIGEKFYFIAKGKVSIHVPRPNKEIFKQEKNYQLRKYWGDQIDLQTLTANERETAKVHYQRARAKILKYQEKYHPEKFYKKLQSCHPPNSKIFQKYFHQQYKTFGLYKQVNELKEGQSFGEVATISRKLRTASVLAEEDLHLFYMRGKDYLTVFQQQLYKLNFILKNIERQFEDLSKKQILDLSYLFEAFENTLHLNQQIFKEGSERQFIYLIKSGSVAFKSSKGISLGIIGEGEFFGFENKKGTEQGLLNEKHSFSAYCIANGTIVYRLKVQLLEEEDFHPALKEFAIKGFQKAEYYSKRAIHCQNIFQQNEANNPYNAELQNYSDFASPKSSFQNESPLAKAKNLRKLMNKLQIQKKFNKYLEENFASKQQKASSSQALDGEKSGRQSQIGSFGSNLQLLEQISDQKESQVSIGDNLIQPLSSSHRLQTSPPVHISNQINDNEIQIHSFMTADQINSLNFNTHFKKPDSASIQKSYNQQHQNQNSHDVAESQQFHFVSKEDFEQTKNHIIKEQEKLRAKKAQHYVPQEIADMPLSRKISQKFASSSSLLSGTPQSATNKQPPPLSSFFAQQQQPSSPLKSPSSSSPLKLPVSPLKQTSQKEQQQQQSLFFPNSVIPTVSSSNLANTNVSSSVNSNFVATSINQQLGKRQNNKSPFNKRMSVDSLAQIAQQASEQKQNILYNSQQNLLNRREGTRGSLLISSIQIPARQSEIRNSSTKKQRISAGEEQLGTLLIPQQSTSYLASSPLIQKSSRASCFSYTQPSTNMTKSISSINIQDKINFNIQQSPPTNPKSPPLSSVSKSPLINFVLHSPHDLYHPQSSNQGYNESSTNINYSIPSAYRNQQFQETDEVIQHNPLIMRPIQKSFLNISNSNQDQSNLVNGSMNDTFKKFNRTHNILFDKKMLMNLAVTDLNFPQNNKPSITSITLKSVTDFSQQQQLQNSQGSPSLQPSSITHRRSYSQMQSPQQSDYQLQKQNVPKNKQYTQLFKKNNESKSLKKKQKIMPLLMNEQTTAGIQNPNLQNGNNLASPAASSQPMNSTLYISASKSYTNGFPNIVQRKKIPSLFTHSSQQNIKHNNPLQSPILKADKLIQANYPHLNSKHQPKLSITGLQQQSLNLLSPPTLPQSSRPSLQIQQFCSIKQFLDGNENVNNIKYDIIQYNQNQKNL